MCGGFAHMNSVPEPGVLNVSRCAGGGRDVFAFFGALSSLSTVTVTSHSVGMVGRLHLAS